MNRGRPRAVVQMAARWEMSAVSWAARKRGSSVPRARGSGATPAGLLRVGGRAVLWCLVLVLLLRGASDVMAVEERAPARSAPRDAAAAWPDDAARAFALGFARAYLTLDPAHPDAYARGLERYVAPELADAIVPQFERGGEPQVERSGARQVVQDAAVAATARVDDRHALITVAVALDGGTRHLTVPLARDAAGGLVVFDLPSFAPPPRLAHDAAPALEPLTGSARVEVEDVLTRFFEAFLAGDAAQLEYLVPAGVRIGALAEPHELVALASVGQLGAGDARERTVLATIRARDEATGVVYGLRYRLRLVRGDRWYVAAVNQTTPKEG
jgi:Conjugative transposon protein TcpC